MESAIAEPSHSTHEIGNEYACQGIIKKWIDNPKLPSALVIPQLHRELQKGVKEYERMGFTPQLPGSLRTTEVETDQRPQNFFVHSLDVAPTMQKYTSDLDTVLRAVPTSPADKLGETIHNAAWAYYAFERIHPYLDGNGRVGRMILKRVMKGRGYKDIIFATNAANGKGRAAHLDAMQAVDNTGNLAHLELYLLKQLSARYAGSKDEIVLRQIRELSESAQSRIASQTEKYDLATIWEGFKGLDLDGVKEPQYTGAA